MTSKNSISNSKIKFKKDVNSEARKTSDREAIVIQPDVSTTQNLAIPKKELTIQQIKNAVYQSFGVKDTSELKKSHQFQMAVSSLGKINYSKKQGWESLYRNFIGILPNEEDEKGYGCLNGINIFKYDLPWRVFDLEPEMASTSDIKNAYRRLSKIYHPDNSATGDGKIFDRINVFYRSLTEGF
jgi:hypothetical protein